MRKVILALIVVVALGFTAKLIAAPSSAPLTADMHFHPHNLDAWEADYSVGKIHPDVDNDHLYFDEDHQIDITLTRQHLDLASELNTLSKDEVIAELMNGEHAVDELFGQPETKVIESSLSRDPLVSILTVHTKQERETGSVESIEKYFIASGQYLRAEFRWKAGTSDKTVQQARADFEAGKLDIDGLKQ